MLTSLTLAHQFVKYRVAVIGSRDDGFQVDDCTVDLQCPVVELVVKGGVYLPIRSFHPDADRYLCSPRPVILGLGTLNIRETL